MKADSDADLDLIKDKQICIVDMEVKVVLMHLI